MLCHWRSDAEKADFEIQFTMQGVYQGVLWDQHFREEKPGGWRQGMLSCCAVTKWPWPITVRSSEGEMTFQRWNEGSEPLYLHINQSLNTDRPQEGRENLCLLPKAITGMNPRSLYLPNIYIPQQRLLNHLPSFTLESSIFQKFGFFCVHSIFFVQLQ